MLLAECGGKNAPGGLHSPSGPFEFHGAESVAEFLKKGRRFGGIDTSDAGSPAGEFLSFPGMHPGQHSGGFVGSQQQKKTGGLIPRNPAGLIFGEFHETGRRILGSPGGISISAGFAVGIRGRSTFGHTL